MKIGIITGIEMHNRTIAVSNSVIVTSTKNIKIVYKNGSCLYSS